jgi:hypothetical protein
MLTSIDCLITITREEGIRGLYKGVVPALFLTSHGAIQVFILFNLYHINIIEDLTLLCSAHIAAFLVIAFQFASYEWLKSQSMILRANGGEQVILQLSSSSTE